MTKYKVGDVVSIEFPFSNLQGQKRRPGLVLASGDMDLLVARVTTHPPRDETDVPLHDWAEIGLPLASTVRLSKLATIDHRLVHHAIGHLHADDASAVEQAWMRLANGVAVELRA